MAFTSPPAAPNVLDPATFPARASAWVAWFTLTFIPELVSAMLAFGPGSPFCAVTGGSNNLTLSSGLNLSALAVGQRITFRPNSPNTTAVTLAVDGLSPQSARTPSDTPLPAGYLRAGVFTQAVWSGTVWIVSRDVEAGSNANGRFTRMEDGTLLCRREVTITSSTSEQTFTFPADFVAAPSVAWGGGIGAARSTGGTDVGPRSRLASVTSVSAGLSGTSWAVRADPSNFTSLGTVADFSATLTAYGRWY